MIVHAQEQDASEFSASTYSLFYSCFQHAMSKVRDSSNPALLPSAMLMVWPKRLERDLVNAS